MKESTVPETFSLDKKEEHRRQCVCRSLSPDLLGQDKAGTASMSREHSARQGAALSQGKSLAVQAHKSGSKTPSQHIGIEAQSYTGLNTDLKHS